jgi:hypothetical protein
MDNNGNNKLTDTARQAIRRIQTLQALHQRTGLSTMAEIFQVLVNLPDDDALVVCDTLNLSFKKDGVRRG